MKIFSAKKKRVITSLLLTGLVLNLLTACGTNNSITQGKNDTTGTDNIADRNDNVPTTPDTTTSGTADNTTNSSTADKTDHTATGSQTNGSGSDSVMDDIGNTAEDVADDVADGVQDIANDAKDTADHLVGSANANNKMNR